MKNAPHWVGWIGWPILIVWFAGWLGAFAGSVYFLISIVRFAIWALS